MPYWLIQLVSEKTMPNVLPALALSPAKVVLLHSSPHREYALWIRKALAVAKLRCEVELRALSEAPEMEESHQAVTRVSNEAINASHTPVINITGGTKLMSIGAFIAAYQGRWCALYVDAPHARFIAASQHAPLPPQLQDNSAALQHLESMLTVSILTAAHGCEMVSPGQDPEPFLELAEYLRTHPAQEGACNYYFGALRMKPRAASYLEFGETPLPSSLPGPVLELAGKAGLLEKRGEAWHVAVPTRKALASTQFGPENRTEFFAAIRPVQRSVSLLAGAWLEVSVWLAAQQSGRFRDLRWSACFGTPEEHAEEDVVGVDGLNLAVFSCKRASVNARLWASFREFLAASNRLGGSYASRIFCTARSHNPEHHKLLYEEAKRLGVRIISSAQSLHSGAFD